MQAGAKLLIGLGAVAGIGYLSVHANILPGSRASALNKLERVKEDRLAIAQWAQVRLDGQKLSIIGEAPTPETLAATKKAAGEASLLSGPITRIDFSAAGAPDLPPIIDPHLWVAERQNDTIDLSGAAPSQGARDAVYQLAAMRFSDTALSGELDIARSVVDEETWTSAASIALQALARLERGAVEIENNTITLTGTALDAVRADVVRQLIETTPAPFTTSANLELAPPPPLPDIIQSDLPAPDLEDAPENTQPASSEEDISTDSPSPVVQVDCLNEVRKATSEVQVEFASAQTDPDGSSRQSLDRLAAIISACEKARITITGHTDSTGGFRRNDALSLYRADSVAAYLQASGVNRAQLATRGAGEREPLTSNETPAGRARNRRIEFTVNADQSGLDDQNDTDDTDEQ
ncbi:MAG: OmpA family protein [Pseudomonadota bacterium]